MRKKILCGILALTMTMTLTGEPSPASVYAAETGGTAAIQTETEEGTEEKAAEETAEPETNLTEDEKTTEETTETVSEAEETEPAAEELQPTEEEAVDDDPQRARAEGNISAGFLGEDADLEMGTMAVTHNKRFNGYTIRNGIDVSKYQPSINWSKVKNAGVDFAFVRLGFRGYGESGSLNMDPTYSGFMRGAIDAGLNVGVYFFSQATSKAEAREEAAYILNNLGGYKVTMPIVMDFEYAGNNIGRLYNAHLSRSAATDICMEFCKEISKAGYEPMVYANKDMLENKLDANRIAEQYMIWMANYTDTTAYNGPYDFWQYTSKGSVNGISGNVDRDFWYTKTYEVVSYDTNGGTKIGTKKYLNQGETYGKLPVPEKNGCEFLGWFTQPEGGTSVTAETKAETSGKVVLYAQWRKGTEVKFETLGGKVSPASKYVYEGETYGELPVPVKIGYEFLGWFTEKEGGSKVEADTACELTETQTLYAHWKICDYSITYYLDGGENNVNNPAFYNYSAKAIVLQNPARTGYTFAGWYTDSKFKTKATQIPAKSAVDKEFYAKWTPNTYTIRFDKNGANTGSTAAMSSRKYDTVYVLSNNGYVKYGYRFTGWNTEKDGSGTAYENKAEVKNLCDKKGASITLYAQWDETAYTITYETNGGTNSESNPASYLYTDPTIVLQNPTNPGYVFSGWYSDSKLRSKVTKIPAKSYGDKTLYAKWTPILYNVKFDGNGAESGKNPAELKNCKYGTAYTIAANPYQRQYYTFDGWNTEKDGSGIACKNGEKALNLTTVAKAQVTLYAQWKPIEFPISYQLEGGTNNPENPESYNIESDEITFRAPTKAGFVFGGWYTCGSYEIKQVGIEKGTTGEVAVKAKWLPRDVSAVTVQWPAALKSGQSLDLGASVGITSNNSQGVSWFSENEDYAAVSSTGVVECKAAGRVVITAVSTDQDGREACVKVTLNIQ